MAIVQRISSKIKRRIRLVRQELKAALGLYTTTYQEARGARIIVYHGICKTRPTRFNTLFITQKTFETHLRFYKKYFHVISMDDYCRGQFRSGRFNVCLSFDDGFANNCHYALPLLEKYELPATFFITAIRNDGADILWNDFLTLASVTGPKQLVFEEELFRKKHNRTYFSTATGLTLSATLQQHGYEAKKQLMSLLQQYAVFRHTNALSDYWRQMTVEEIRRTAASPFITIGSHGYYHNDLSQLPLADAAEELHLSKTYLEQVTGKPIYLFAFPYGNYTAAVVEEGVNAGYRYLLTTSFKNAADKDNPVLKERMGINPFISVKNQMYAIIKGNYES